MKGVGAALAAALRAPVAEPRLAFALWTARLLPLLFVLGLPLYAEIEAASAHHPDASLLLDPARDRSGFAAAWTADLFRGPLRDASDRLFWLVLAEWTLVTVLAGGITARLLGDSTSLVAASGKFAVRFLRLGVLTIAMLYAVEVLLDVFLARKHDALAKTHHTQDYVIGKAVLRGVLVVVAAWLLGVVHAYARIDVVRGQRRSAVLSWFRGAGTLLARLPSLLLLELGLVALTAAAAGFAWLAMRLFLPPSQSAGAVALALFVVAAAAGSYVRTGIEVGCLAARCRLVRPEAPPEPSRNETLPSWLDDDGEGVVAVPAPPAT